MQTALRLDAPQPPGELIEPPEFQTTAHKGEDAQIIRDLLSQNRMLMQLCQALGDYNRYLASEALGRAANDNEAFLHYVLSGGKIRFDEDHPHPK